MSAPLDTHHTELSGSHDLNRAEEEQPRLEGARTAAERVFTRQSCCNTFRNNALPFLKLWSPAPPSEASSRTAEEIFFGASLIWISAAGMFCYLLLTISCWTSETGAEQGGKHFEKKAPGVGSHFPYVILVKEAVQLAVLHRLCTCLMEPLEGLKETRSENLEKMHPLGIVHHSRRLMHWIVGSTIEPRWLSSFVADHILLMLVGGGAVLHQISIAWIKVQLSDVSDVDYVGNRYLIVILLEMFACSYMGILVCGFLYTTLEFNIVPKEGRQKEFMAFMALFILLWTVDFLAVLLDREVYMSAWVPFHVHAWQRVLAAAAQIFTTHSTVMLGAVLLGHSAHFKKSPDLTWSTLICKGMPVAVCLGFYLVWSAIRRRVHTNMSCHPEWEVLLTEAWPYFNMIYIIAFGLLLLGLTFKRPSVQVDGDGSDILNLVDYDTALVAITFSIAILWNINQIFYMEGLHIQDAWICSILELLGPIGLASFTMSVWRRPPGTRACRHSRFTAGTLWFALLFAGTQFINFQDKEDCETSSNMPGCCMYPYFGRYNTLEARSRTCDSGFRCSEKHAMKVNGSEEEVWCAIPEEEEVHHEPESRPRRQYGLLRSLSSRNNSRPRFGGPIPLSNEQCNKSKMRWKDFQKNGYLRAEVEEEEEQISTVYKLLTTVGQTASTEMYFTILGVLLKVIFLTQHPNSEEILTMQQHHHHVGHNGEHTTVAICPVTHAKTEMPRTRTTFVNAAPDMHSY